MTQAPATINKREYVRIGDPEASRQLSGHLRAFIESMDGEYSCIIFMCIGSDRATGDSLGPIIGQKLTERLQGNFVKVYGSLNRPVHAVNIKGAIEQAYLENKRPLMVAIDAALARNPESVGFINVGMGPLTPGAYANKKLPEIGHIHMTGVVNWANRLNDMETLRSTRLAQVMRMADIMAEGVILAVGEGSAGFKFGLNNVGCRSCGLQR